MNKTKFTPIEFLQPSEVALLEKTRINIRRAKNKEDLSYYESVLDNLMKAAIKNFKEKKPLQYT